MKNVILLTWICIPCVLGRSPPTNPGEALFRVRPFGVLETPRGGGRSNSESTLPFDADAVASFLNAAKTVFVEEVAPVVHRESKNALKYAKNFVKEQKKQAAKRRAKYKREAKNLSSTASTLTDPARAFKLTVSAFVIAEALNFIDGESFYWEEVSDDAEKAVQIFRIQLDNFLEVGRDEGGLLRGETWVNRKKWFAAVQKQVDPKYQVNFLKKVTSRITWLN